jgi:hypothetical protein
MVPVMRVHLDQGETMKRVLGPGAICDCPDGCCELCCPESDVAELTHVVFEDIDEEPEEYSEEDE